MVKRYVSEDEQYFELAGVMLIRLDSNGKVVRINKKGCEILGYSKKDIIGKDWFSNFLPKRMRKQVRDVFNKLMKGEVKPVEFYENPIVNKKGEERVIAWHNTMIKDNGNIFGILSSGEDVTERKKTEEELRESEEKFKTLSDNSPDGIFIHCEGIFLDMNETFPKMLGYTKKELIGKKVNSVVTRKSALKGKKYIKKQDVVVEYEGVRKDKTVFQAEVIGHNIKYKGKDCRIATVRDVTEKKKVEDIVKEEKDFSEAILNTAQTIVLILSKEGKIIYFNPYMENLTGYKLKEVKGKDWFSNFLPKKDRAKIKKIFLKAVENIQTKGNVNQIITRSGEKKYVEWYDKTLTVNEHFLGLLAVGQDITEKIEDENKLKKSEERFRNSICMATLMAYDYNIDSDELFLFGETKKTIGYSDKEMKGNVASRWKKMVHPEDRKRAYDLLNKCIKTGERYDTEYRVKHKNGSYIFVEDHAAFIFNKNGKAVRLLGTVKNITERKKVEEKLKESESTLKLVANSGSLGMDIIDEKLNIVWMNDIFLKIFGKKSIGKKCYELYKDDKKQCKECPLRKGIKVGESKKIIVKGVAGGKTFEINHTGIIHKGKKAILESFSDVTEKYKLQKKYETITSTTIDCMKLVDLKGKIKYLNDASVKNHSLKSKNKGIDQKIWDIPPHNIKKKVITDFSKAKKGKTFSVEYVVPLKNGKNKYIFRTYSPVRDDKGKIESIYVQCRNITVLKEAQEKLKEYQELLEGKVQESENKYKTIYETSADAIMTLAPPKWTFTSGNKATVKMFNAGTEKKFVSLGPWEVSPKKQPDGQLSSDKAKKMIMKAMKTGSNFFEWTHKRYKGEDFYATVLLTRMKIEGKTLLQATVRDITKHKEAELKIKEQVEKLKGLDEMKSQFLSSVSHELRTPITPIKAQTQRMLTKDLVNGERKESLNMILRNTVRLDRLIQDILEISRMQSGRLKIIRNRQSINPIITEAIEIMKPLADEKNVKVHFKVSKMPLVLVDRDRILEVLTNLIDNGLIYGKRNNIYITVIKDGDYLKVVVKDKGEGISEKNLDNIFKPFFREKKVWLKRIQGTGLGLPICKGIVEGHGGMIGVKSCAGKGSEFYFKLPIKTKRLKKIKTEVKEDEN